MIQDDCIGVMTATATRMHVTNTADLCCVRISSFAVDDSVGWLVQVSLTLFAFTPSTSLALPVNAKNVRLTCTSQPTESSTVKLEIRTQHKSTVLLFSVPFEHQIFCAGFCRGSKKQD